MRVVVLEAREAHLVDQGLHPLGDAVRDGHAAELQGQQHVLAQGPPGKQVVLLGHVADLGVQPAGALSPEMHLPAAGREEPGQDVQQGALAAPARPHDGHELPFANIEVHVGHRMDDGPPREEPLADLPDGQRRRHRIILPELLRPERSRPGGAVEKSIVEGVTPQPPLSGGLFSNPSSGASPLPPVRGIAFIPPC